MGFTVTNLNPEAASASWSVSGGPSGSVGPLAPGASASVDIDFSFAGALVTITFSDGSLSASLPTDCVTQTPPPTDTPTATPTETPPPTDTPTETPPPTEPTPTEMLGLQVVGFCTGVGSDTFGWTVINPNGFDVSFEWAVNGSSLAGLGLVSAGGAYNFTTPKAEGTIIMIFVGGVMQGDATGVETCQDPTEPTQPPPTSDIPVPPGGGPPILIPVTGASNSASGLMPHVLLNLGLGFAGLGLVTSGLASRKKKAAQSQR
jgi:hypothetical protein